MHLPPASPVPPAEAPADGLVALAADADELVRLVSRLARLPSEPAAFAARYGRFEAAAAAADVIDAAACVQRLNGRAVGLRARLVSRLRQAGQSAATLGGKPPWHAAPPARSAIELAAQRRWALSGAGGVAMAATATATSAEALRAELAALAGEVAAAVTRFHRTQLLNRANVAIGALQAAAERAKQSRRAWWRLARARAAAAAAALQEELARKQALVDDAATLLSDGEAALAALGRLDTRLQALARTFAGAAERLASVAQLADAQQLGDDAWLEAALDRPAMLPQWAAVAAAAQRVVATGGTAPGAT